VDTAVAASGTVLLITSSPRLAIERADAALRVVATGDDRTRPHLYEVGDENIVLLGARGLELSTHLHDDGLRRFELPALGRHNATTREAQPGVPYLIEIAAPIDRVGFVDPIAASVVGLGGLPQDRAAFANAIVHSAGAAGVAVVILRTAQREIDEGPSAKSCATIAEVLAELAPRRSTGLPTLVLVDAEFADRSVSELTDLAHETPQLGIVLVEPGANADVFLALPAPPRAYFGPLGPTSATAPSRAAIQPSDEGVEISILGPTEIHGVGGSLVGRPRLTELVVYLAMHPEGAGTRTWSAALWPERRVPPQTVANRLSEARGLLGFAADGRPRLRRSGDRHLIAEVATDWSRFCAMSTPAAGPAGWRSALRLVRGRPFDDLAQGSWTMLEGFTGEINQGIVDCALRLGEHCLSESDPQGAAEAAQLAIRASPWDERLHRLLMRAADAAGNRHGVEAVFRHLALVLEVDGDPMVGVHPETAALYARLVGQQATSAR
jgi:DNA-binding SARP family transcriptional activator